MLVPKWLLGVLLAAGAVCLGWIAKDALGGIASSSAEPPEPDPASEDSTDELVEALAALSSTTQDDRSPPTPVELTIILGDGRDQPMVAPGLTRPGRSPVRGIPSLGTADAPGGGAAGTGLAVAASRTGAARTQAVGPEAHRPIAARGYAVRPWNGAPDVTPTSGHRGPPLRSLSAAPRLAAPRPIGAMATGGFSLSLSPEMAATAIGDHIVIAYDDSIVLVGDYGRLTGNTGDAGQGGVVALDAQGSAFTTRLDAAGGTYAAQGNAATLATGGPGSGAQAGSATVAGNGTMTALVGGTGGYIPNAPPGVVSPLISPIVSFSTGRAVDIAGYEDHSLAVRGQRNVVTYDDSNVFIDRFGQVNANTGDTDSAGLNAVDTVRSNVSAGPHCDDGCDDESIIQAKAGVFDEGDVAIDGHGNVVWAPDRGDGDNAADQRDDSPPGDTGDDEDADNAAEDESDDGDVSDPVEPPESRDEADSDVDPAQRPPGDSLVIGGDGYDDLGVRVDGQDQVVTYDDSNVVMGGVGDVNAQIGDSDTGGTVTMGTVDSEVHGGNSR